ncbi:MAG: hypothetical protein E7575_02670 [Ruminococcaceae bacterium]|nr:hypothetical protein [Oscillospiraceae bacterium]
MKKNKFNLSGSVDLIFALCAAVAVIAIDSLLCAYTSVHPIFTGVLSAIILFAAVVAFAVIRRNTAITKRRAPSHDTASVLAYAVVDLPEPCFVLRGSDPDAIIWSNKRALELFGKSSRRLSEIFTPVSEDGEEERVAAGERRYAPVSYQTLGDNGREYCICIMQDVTEEDAEIERLCQKESAVAYVTVDNLDELLNYEQEDYRSASGQAERILRQWATDAGGVLKEYQQDKYILICERSNIAKFANEGFDILDKIREIRVGANSIPVTISMGICSFDGTPGEREKAAQSALETALQRGGDQVVVKTENSTDIFGGKTKLPQKRTKVKARVIANELVSHISSSSNVIIMGHRFADFDAFGAMVGLARLCMFCGVDVNIVTDLEDSNLDRCREWLLGEKDYGNVFIDSDSAMDLISSDTLLIIADVNNMMQFESRALSEHCQRIAIIDHHRKTAEFEKKPLITYIEPAASAASELVAEMLEQVLPQNQLLSVEAELLMAGILLDTNQFKKNTGTRTFSAALYLRGRGADVGKVQELFKTELYEFQRELKFHSNVEIYRDITAIAIPEGECTVKDKVPAAKAADKLLTVEGVMASFAVVPIGNEVHISARSTGTINVQLLLEKLNGGGHFDSAGTRIENVDVKAALEMLKGAIDSYLNENPQ